eukprot:Gb_11993 [translate_table: standard]
MVADYKCNPRLGSGQLSIQKDGRIICTDLHKRTSEDLTSSNSESKSEGTSDELVSNRSNGETEDHIEPLKNGMLMLNPCLEDEYLPDTALSHLQMQEYELLAPSYSPVQDEKVCAIADYFKVTKEQYKDSDQAHNEFEEKDEYPLQFKEVQLGEAKMEVIPIHEHSE